MGGDQAIMRQIDLLEANGRDHQRRREDGGRFDRDRVGGHQ